MVSAQPYFRRGLGFTIFVDNISRRIHTTTLRESFQENENEARAVGVFTAKQQQPKQILNKAIGFWCKQQFWKLKDTRTFKEALLGRRRSLPDDHLANQFKMGTEKVSPDSDVTALPGRIVQVALSSDGFQASVGFWFGHTAVIRFPNKEERARC
ncbi:hypothetical protein V6N12_029631 [Hibiscus sabdariffa]|uniref:Uncharacterized protein n=1 Tax=Hibiscus sabdariffa TaxID=183260 RepID=A0ABR2CX25_9ROSI